MNYIKRLQRDNAEQATEIAEIKQEIRDLVGYLQSEKFNCGNELDGYVNVSDVIARLSAA